MLGSQQPRRTPQVCAIGNSHLASLKFGWRGFDTNRPSIDIAFFGSKSQSLSKSYVFRGALRSNCEKVRESLRHTGGADHILLGKYDEFLIVGGGVHFRLLAKMLEDHCVYPFVQSGKTLVSVGVLAHAVRARVIGTSAYHLSKLIKSETSMNIYVVTEPYYCESALADRDLRFMKDIDQAGMSEMLSGLFEACCREVFGGLATVLFQPASTRTKQIFTKSTYAVGAVGLKASVPGVRAHFADRVHKNADFGKAVLEGFLIASGLDRVAPIAPMLPERMPTDLAA